MLTRNLLLATILLGSTALTSPLLAQSDEPVSEPTEEEMLDEETSAETENSEEETSLEELVEANPELNLVEGEGGDEMEMLADVLFEFGSTKLNESSLSLLISVAETIEEYPEVHIIGHTDAIGSEEANLDLGLRRAEAVRDYIVENSGMTIEQVITSSVGETEPVVENTNDDGSDNVDGRALNRRVVFFFPDHAM